MFRITVSTLILVAGISFISVSSRAEPPSHPMFDVDAVNEIHLTFHQPDWWELLRQNFEGQEDPAYLAAEFDWEEVHFDSIGVRFKGNSSYNSYPGDKKSFKLDIDEYIDGQDIYGLDKLNLNNGFKDPSFIREVSFYELARATRVANLRANFAALYINGEYWGLYSLVEQLDQEFIEGRFGSGENGNLWKGDPHGTLEWRGPDEASYYSDYELKTNEEENDWSALVDMVDALNNTSTADLPDSIGDRVEIGSAMAMLALNSLTVNLDSYNGTGHNFYFYHRDSDSRIIFMHWDANEAWGCFNFGMPVHQLKTLPPLWLFEPPWRPLGDRLWHVGPYADLCVGYMKLLMAGPANPDTLLARMEELRDLVRPYVLADTKKMYSNQDFEDAVQYDIGGGPGGVSPGLEPFIRGRDAYLRSVIGSWTLMDGLVLNELMASNDTTLADDHGEFDDWIEISNTGDETINLTGLSLTDNLAFPNAFVFGDTTIAPGEYMIVWCDDTPEQGSLHAGFKLGSSGESVYLLDNGVLVDETTFPALGTDISWGRWPDGSGEWKMLGAATPGAENEDPDEPEEVVLFINEFLAINETVNQDETDAFEDWVEIYNPGPDPVEMGGLFLTDDPADPTQWTFPDTTIAAGGFLLVWCDNDEEDGPLHTNFKLGGSGEEIGLFGRIAAGNPEIDSYVFGAQTADISEGRETDGELPWVFFETPTPGASNGGSAVVAGDEDSRLVFYPCRPAIFSKLTVLSFLLPQEGRVRLELFDVRGRRVALLLDRSLGAGVRSVRWLGTDDAGRPVASGVYLARLKVGETSTIQRVMRIW